jgi:hypothetical protein
MNSKRFDSWERAIDVKRWETWESYTNRIAGDIPAKYAINGYGEMGPTDGEGSKVRIVTLGKYEEYLQNGPVNSSKIEKGIVSP